MVRWLVEREWLFWFYGGEFFGDLLIFCGEVGRACGRKMVPGISLGLVWLSSGSFVLRNVDILCCFAGGRR